MVYVMIGAAGVALSCVAQVWYEWHNCVNGLGC